MPHFNDVIAHRRSSASSFARKGQLQEEKNPAVYAASVTPDLDKGDLIDLTLTGALTLANPTGQQAGRVYRFVLRQDPVGTRLLTLGTGYKVAGGALVLTTAASAVDTVSFLSDGTNLQEVSRSLANA